VGALTHIDARSQRDFASARTLLERAIDLDPFYAHAYAVLAWLTVHDAQSGWKPISAHDDAFEAAQRSVALDDHDAWSHFALALVCLVTHRVAEAVTGFERALALNPNFPHALSLFGAALSYLGRGEEALSKLEMAERLNPSGAFRGTNAQLRSTAYFAMGKHRDALDCAQKAVQEAPGRVAAHRQIVVNSALLGQLDEAKRALEDLKRLHPSLTLAWINEWNPWVDPEARQKLVRGFELAGLR
jgi:tetratricopeptide (TPR) repeat protein